VRAEYCEWCEELDRLSGVEWQRCLFHWAEMRLQDDPSMVPMIWSAEFLPDRCTYIGGQWCNPPGFPVHHPSLVPNLIENVSTAEARLRLAREALEEIKALVDRPVQLTIGETAAVRAIVKHTLRETWAPATDDAWSPQQPTEEYVVMPPGGDIRDYLPDPGAGPGPLPWNSKGVEERDRHRRGDVGLHATVAFPERGGPWS
jgi:hypothetical protein